MITTSLARVARSACSSAPVRASAPISGQQYTLAIRNTTTTRTHQRRLSSSKASAPSDGAAPRGRSSAPSQRSSASTGRVRGRKPKAAVVEDAAGFAHLPSVPSTQHLKPADINVSSFFSLHRPISVTTAIPESIDATAFSEIFTSKPSIIRHQPQEVFRTLGSTVEELEQAYPEDDAFGEEAAMVATNLDARDGVPQDMGGMKTGQYRMYVPPPVPEPVIEAAPSPKKKRASKKETKPRSWRTTITVTEHTNVDGQKVYSAASTPLERVSIRNRREIVEKQVVEEPETADKSAPMQQPFLQRMRIRQLKDGETKRPNMFAISVKRQRKLKMKKHKYKKLMKRTRNQRRRLGKL